MQIALVLLLSLIGVSSGIAQEQSADSLTGKSYTPPERWSEYLHRTFGPTRLALLGAETAVDHGFGEPSCWDASGAAYVQRYARAFDRRLIKNTTEFATGVLTREDLRYRKAGSRSIRGRVWNVFRASVVAKMPDGTERPAYTRFFASATTELSTAHWVGQPIRTRWEFQSVGWSVLDQAETNLMDEFSPDLRRIAIRLWDVARSRPGNYRQPRSR
jgi:hypothetical protein